MISGGQTGIRTLGRLAPTTVFETAPFDHSGTCPQLWVTNGFFQAPQLNVLPIESIESHCRNTHVLDVAKERTYHTNFNNIQEGQ